MGNTLENVRRGAAAGLAGSLAASALVEVLAGREPPFRPERAVGRLARERWGLRLTAGGRRGAGRAARLLYGPLWGAALALTRSALRPTPRGAGLGLGLAVLAFEAWALPASGATPPLRAWRPGEPLLLAAKALAFGLTAAAFLRRRERVAFPRVYAPA